MMAVDSTRFQRDLPRFSLPHSPTTGFFEAAASGFISRVTSCGLVVWFGCVIGRFASDLKAKPSRLHPGRRLCAPKALCTPKGARNEAESPVELLVKIGWRDRFAPSSTVAVTASMPRHAIFTNALGRFERDWC
ncbi:hypothetical protein [Shewanella zhangzhouensis]|uniref:hypothetical protein n=1 Tax=Shewanella zhangzhouensis TaxID=2864213 RepID=UPI001C65BCB6|nr:hypothetical protein [Shewanella zhangzhouensis]QYK06379.1 hypothetical protein K0H63_06050 [Shewanella zhangzhouensis]